MPLLTVCEAAGGGATGADTGGVGADRPTLLGRTAGGCCATPPNDHRMHRVNTDPFATAITTTTRATSACGVATYKARGGERRDGGGGRRRQHHRLLRGRRNVGKPIEHDVILGVLTDITALDRGAQADTDLDLAPGGLPALLTHIGKLVDLRFGEEVGQCHLALARRHIGQDEPVMKHLHARNQTSPRTAARRRRNNE